MGDPEASDEQPDSGMAATELTTLDTMNRVLSFLPTRMSDSLDDSSAVPPPPLLLPLPPGLPPLFCSETPVRGVWQRTRDPDFY